MFAHFDAPYPNDHDKNLLAALTGMPRAQVCLPCYRPAAPFACVSRIPRTQGCLRNISVEPC